VDSVEILVLDDESREENGAIQALRAIGKIRGLLLLRDERSPHRITNQEPSRNLPTDSSSSFHALQGWLAHDRPRTQQALFPALFCTPSLPRYLSLIFNYDEKP
jgi:hypothetical protein